MYVCMYLFIVSRGAREERESPGRLPAEHGAWLGAWSHDPEIMAWAETKSRMLKRLSHQVPQV